MSNAVNRVNGMVCVGSGVSLDFRDLMKAERRHELETNDLAKKIIQAPDYFKLYGGRIALALVVLTALALLVNYRIRSKREDLAAAQTGVAEVREAVTQLGSPNLMGPPEQLAMRRQQMISDATAAIERVNEHSEDPKLLAQAAVLRGDLFWTIANLTEVPGAATRPALALEPKPDVALDQAQSAYKRVVDGYPGEQLPAVTSRFGLAAVAENQAIGADANTPAVYKTQATQRLRLLASLQKGVYLATATQPATPSTGAVAPTTVPAAPSTQSIAR
jgi:hypothetical protein